MRYFIAVAEELHFGHAAAQLSLSQSALSRAISTLEDQLGTRLFKRTSRHVELTPTGAAFLEHARALLARQAQALDDLRRTDRGAGPLIRLGFVAGFAGQFGTAVLARFASRHPDIELRLERLAWTEQTSAIRDGIVDVAFVRLPCANNELRMSVVGVEPRVVLVSSRNRLSQAASIRLRDLADQRVCRPAGGPPEAISFWSGEEQPFTRARTRPRGPEVHHLDEALEYAAANLAVVIVPASVAQRHRREDLVAVGLEDAAPSQLAVAWRRDSAMPELREFLGVVRVVLQSEGRLTAAASAPAAAALRAG